MLTRASAGCGMLYPQNDTCGLQVCTALCKAVSVLAQTCRHLLFVQKESQSVGQCMVFVFQGKGHTIIVFCHLTVVYPLRTDWRCSRNVLPAAVLRNHQLCICIRHFCMCLVCSRPASWSFTPFRDLQIDSGNTITRLEAISQRI